MKKNEYKKPTMRVVKIEKRLLTVVSPNPEGGEGEARGYRGGWDDSNE